LIFGRGKDNQLAIILPFRGGHRPCESCDFTRRNNSHREIGKYIGKIIKKNRGKLELSRSQYWHCIRPCNLVSEYKM